MTDELQNGSFDSDESLEAENLEQGAELATASEEQHEENTQAETEVNQEAINKVINKKHFEKMEAERKAKEAADKAAELEEKLKQYEAQQVGEVPSFPDRWEYESDEDFAKAQREYNDALTRKAAYDAQQAQTLQAQQAQQQQELIRQQQELQQKAISYTENASKFGISAEELKTAGGKVASYGASEGLTMAILADEEGPLITKYLATNPVEVEELSAMNPYQAGAKLVEIKSKAQALKPKTSNTPPPATKVDQQAVDPEAGQMKYAKGGSFE